MNPNYSKTQPIDQNQNQCMNNINSTGFAFHLGQVNKIKPKQLRKLDIIHLIRTNNIPELNSILYDLSQENFAENDYFEFQKDELKLVKTYQMSRQIRHPLLRPPPHGKIPRNTGLAHRRTCSASCANAAARPPRRRSASRRVLRP